METNPQEPERRVEEAKASLMARLEELSKRIRETKDKLDLPAKIAAHPLPAVGIAFAVGMLLGSRGRSRRVEREGERERRGMGGAVFAALTAMAFRLGKDLAIRQFADSARSWWETRSRGPSASERGASVSPSVEPFLEH